MPRNPQSEYSQTRIDFSKEKATSTIYIPSYNVVTNPNVLSTLIPAYDTAVEAISLMPKTNTAVNWYNEKYNTAVPTDPNAQRENKWLVRYQDTTNFALYRVEIPGADLSVGLVPGTDFLDTSVSPGSDFVTAFEALARSPEGNAVNVIDITFVGRAT